MKSQIQMKKEKEKSHADSSERGVIIIGRAVREESHFQGAYRARAEPFHPVQLPVITADERERERPGRLETAHPEALRAREFGGGVAGCSSYLSLRLYLPRLPCTKLHHPFGCANLKIFTFF